MSVIWLGVPGFLDFVWKAYVVKTTHGSVPILSWKSRQASAELGPIWRVVHNYRLSD